MPATLEQTKEITKNFNTIVRVCSGNHDLWLDYTDAIRKKEFTHRRDKSIKWGLSTESAIRLKSINLIFSIATARRVKPDNIKQMFNYDLDMILATIITETNKQNLYKEFGNTEPEAIAKMTGFLDNHSFNNLIKV